jgi:L-alanine-DL-glutamate epimerase-like enolase superfamily enzyme
VKIERVDIEHHWQYLYRNAHFRGAAVGAALSAIDIALWDIAGKHFEAPAYRLLGGKCRPPHAGRARRGARQYMTRPPVTLMACPVM